MIENKHKFRFNLKSILYIFIYVSIIFFVWYLYRADYLHMPVIHNYTWLGLSFVFLVLGFAADFNAWRHTIANSNMPVKYHDAAASMGLFILGKYLPGKLWVILGRSGYIATKYGYPIGQLSVLSLTAQFIALWAGLVLGTIGVIFFKGLNIWGLLILGLLIFLSLSIFSKFFHNIVVQVFKWLKKDITIPSLNFIQTLKIIPWYFLTWGGWSLGFYFMGISLSTEPLHMLSGLVFPLAGSLGVLTLVAPGGIGVREGIITGFLHLTGVSLEMAGVIAVTSRLWYLVGEVAMFVTGLIIDRILKK